MITLADYRKVLKELPTYLERFGPEQLGDTNRLMNTAQADELTTYRLLIADAFSKKEINAELHKYANMIIDSWKTAAFYERFAVSALIRKTRNDTVLWDYLLLNA